MTQEFANGVSVGAVVASACWVILMLTGSQRSRDYEEWKTKRVASGKLIPPQGGSGTAPPKRNRDAP